MIIAFSGTIYLIFYAINKPPFDIELALQLAAKNDIYCVNTELAKRNVPYENVEHLEMDWLVLRSAEEKSEAKSILLNECAASR
jgi:hypothetical protein